MSHRVRVFDETTARSEDQLRLIGQLVLNAVTTSHNSDGILCGAFRKFALHVRVLSAGTPTTVQFIVQFLNEVDGLWSTYKQGLFASLFYEDADTATEVRECFIGDVLGRQMRVRVVGVGTDAANTFTVSAVLELWH